MTRQNEVSAPEYSLRHFLFANSRLVAEASDLTGGLKMGPLYNDAADVGIQIRSHHTDVVLRYAFSHEEKRGGDIIAWHFVPTPETARKRGPLGVVIFND